MNRAIAPLKQAEDAVLVDTSDLNFEESLEALCNLVDERLPALKRKA
jgi:cytidylate kinase